MRLIHLHDDVMCDTHGALYRVVDNVIESPWFGPVHPNYQEEYTQLSRVGEQLNGSMALIIRGVLISIGAQRLQFSGSKRIDNFSQSWQVLSPDIQREYGRFANILAIAIERLGRRESA